MNKLKIYLDCCCFNRPFDDLTNEKVRFECEAVLTIINQCENGIWELFKSDILDEEIFQMTNILKKLKVLKLYSTATLYSEINNDIINRAKELQLNYKINPFDSLHLASAEYSGADIFLTTDKSFINRAAMPDIKVEVSNPAIWLTEVMFND